MPAGIADGEYYRLLTSMFLHYGLLHLALNMWALWVLGRELEARLGPLRFSVLYLVSGLGGSVACYVFAPASQAAGASGAIYGLFAALFIVFRRLNRDTSAIITVLVINLVLSFSVPGISIEAHLGGLVTGAVLGVALAYAPKAIRNRVLVGTVAALLLFFTAVVIAQTAAINALRSRQGSSRSCREASRGGQRRWRQPRPSVRRRVRSARTGRSNRRRPPRATGYERRVAAARPPAIRSI